MDANMNSSNKILDKAINGVLGHTTKHNIGVITAHRDEYTASENRKRNRQLAVDIRHHGYGYIKVISRYIENDGTADAYPIDDDSFLIIGRQGHDDGALKSFLTSHGKK